MEATSTKPLINLDSLTMSQIRGELKKLGLSQHGIKAILLNRLKQAVKSGAKLSGGEVDPTSLVITNIPEIPTPSPPIRVPAAPVSRPNTRSVRNPPPPDNGSLSKVDRQRIQQILMQSPALMNGALKSRQPESKNAKFRSSPRIRSREHSPSSSGNEDSSKSGDDSRSSGESDDDRRGKKDKHRYRTNVQYEPIIVKKMRKESRNPSVPHKEFLRQAQMELRLEDDNESYDKQCQQLIYEFKILKDKLIEKEQKILELSSELFDVQQNIFLRGTIPRSDSEMQSVHVPELVVTDTLEQVDRNWQLVAQMGLLATK